MQLFVRKSGCNDAELWLNRRRIFSQKEDDHGTTVCTPAEYRLSYFLLQWHLCHQCGRGGQPAAGALRLCLRHDRHPALTYECGQSAGRPAHRYAAQCTGHEAQCAAAHHRLCGGLRHHGPDGCRGGAGAGVFSGGHCQGQRHEHLHHSGQRSLCRPHPRHEPDAQLLRLRCAAVPLPHCGSGEGEH